VSTYLKALYRYSGKDETLWHQAATWTRFELGAHRENQFGVTGIPTCWVVGTATVRATVCTPQISTANYILKLNSVRGSVLPSWPIMLPPSNF
jgi:hypothetical protein